MKNELCFPNKSHIAFEILIYLYEHPEAQDTLDGIVHWWLLERKIKYQSFLVKEALGDLVKNGLLSEWKKDNIETRYGLNIYKLNDIQEIIKHYLKDMKGHNINETFPKPKKDR